MSGTPRKALRLLQRSAINNGNPLPAHTSIALPSGGACRPAVTDETCTERGAAAVNGVVSTPDTERGGRALSAACTAGSLFHRSVRSRTLLVGGAWFGSTCVYYGVMLAPLELGGLSLEMRTAVGALVEVPAYIAMVPLGEQFGRRRTWAGFLSTAGASLVLLAMILTGGDHASGAATATTTLPQLGSAASTAALLEATHPSLRNHAAHYHAHYRHNGGTHHPFVARPRAERAHSALVLDDGGNTTATSASTAGAATETNDATGANSHSRAQAHSSIVLALALLARCGIAGAASLAYVAAAEQFPTSCRNSAVGFGAACGRFASILAPMAVHLLSAPMYALAAVAACAALAALMLPETAGKPITERIESEPL